MIPFAHSFFFSLVICSLVPSRLQIYLLYIEKKPKILLFILNLNQILKPKKNNLKQLTSIQSSPVPVNDVQLYSYVHLIGVLRH